MVQFDPQHNSRVKEYAYIMLYHFIVYLFKSCQDSLCQVLTVTVRVWIC